MEKTELYNVVMGCSPIADIIFHCGMSVYGGEKLPMEEYIIAIMEDLDRSRQDLKDTYKEAMIPGPEQIYQYVCDLQQLTKCDKHLDDY